MSPVKASLYAALIAAAVTAAGFHFWARHRAQEGALLRSTNSSLSFEAYRRAQALRAPTSAASTATSPNIGIAAGPHAPASPGEYRNDGRATPVASLNTFAWASDRGDTATMAKMIFFDGGSRAKAEAYRTSLPEAVRSRWSSPEEMAATILAGQAMQHPYPPARILDTATPEDAGPNRVIMNLPDTPYPGTAYQRTSEGWSFVITEANVDAYLARSAKAARR